MMQRTWKHLTWTHLMWKQRCVMVLVLFGCSGVLSNAYAAAITDAQATGLATVYGIRKFAAVLNQVASVASPDTITEP